MSGQWLLVVLYVLPYTGILLSVVQGHSAGTMLAKSQIPLH